MVIAIYSQQPKKMISILKHDRTHLQSLARKPDNKCGEFPAECWMFWAVWAISCVLIEGLKTESWEFSSLHGGSVCIMDSPQQWNCIPCTKTEQPERNSWERLFFFSLLFRVCGISPTQKPTIHAILFPHTHIKTHFPLLSDTMPRFISTQVAMVTRATERIQWLLTSPSDTTHTLTPLNAHKTSADNKKPAENNATQFIHNEEYSERWRAFTFSHCHLGGQTAHS